MLKILRAALFALVFTMILLPILALVLWAFALRWPWPELWPVFELRGALNALTANGGIAALLQGTAVSLAVALMTVALALPASRVLAFYEFQGKGTVEGLILLPLLVMK